MSGLFGICHPGRGMTTEEIAAMRSVMPFLDRGTVNSHVAHSIGMGVVRSLRHQSFWAIGDLAVVAEADLVNAGQLQEELAALIGPQPSNAEIIATLYRRHGLDFMQHLRGAFAFCLWDAAAQRLVLGVDRLGIRSLYWAQEGERLLFSSRVSAVQTAMKQTVDVNPEALMQVLLFSVISAPTSIYKNIQRLEPGTVLVYERGNTKQIRYWDAAYHEDHSKNGPEWVASTQNALRTAVHRNLESLDARSSGAFLSGGTDSSSVVGFASERQKTNSFTIYFDDSHYSEVHFARTAARHFNTNHFEHCLTPQDAVAALPEVMRYYDEPFANSSVIGSYWCAKLAVDNNMQTLLAGDGGDELFGGNERYATDKRFQLYQSIPKALRKFAIEPLTRLLPEDGSKLSLPRKYVKRANLENPFRILSYEILFNSDPQQAFEPDFLAAVPRDSWLHIQERHFRSAVAESELNRILYLDLKITLGDNDLRKVVGTADMLGLNVRFPFLDHDLVEFSSRIPTSLKLRGFEKRYLFKQAMRGIVPDEILFKKKHGFGVPMGTWFRQDKQMNSMMEDILSDQSTRERGYLRRSFIDQLREKHRTGHVRYFGQLIWYLVVLELWHRQHLNAGQEVAVGR
jgi:asparagine synthase (glutamine-hydrolysing)